MYVIYFYFSMFNHVFAACIIVFLLDVDFIKMKKKKCNGNWDYWLCDLQYLFSTPVSVICNFSV